MDPDLINYESLNLFDVSQLNVAQKKALTAYIYSNSLYLAASDSPNNFIVKTSSSPPHNSRSKTVLGEISPSSQTHSFLHKSTLSENNVSMYEEIVRPFTPKVRPLSKNPEKYQHFLNGFRNQHGVRAKRLYKHSLITTVENIYTARFLEEQNQFKNAVKQSQKVDPMPFSEFVTNYLETKWKSPRLSSQSAFDLISSLDFHRKSCLEADVFCKFMDGTFDYHDLVFYLYTRSQIQKELKIDLSNLHEESLRTKYAHILAAACKKNSITPLRIDSRHIFLQPAEYRKIAQSFFADRPDSLQTISEEVEIHKILAGGQEYVNVTVFLLVMLMEFKRRRSTPKPEVVNEEEVELLLDAITPRLINLLDKILNKLCTYDEALKSIAKKELLTVFTAHVQKLVRGLAKGSLEEVSKVLEFEEGAEDAQDAQLELAKDIISAMQECRQKGIMKENADVLADTPSNESGRRIDGALLEELGAEAGLE